jgi:tRNA A37 threonylcarbamoyladenosine biosynthesis protein TsaE
MKDFSRLQKAEDKLSDEMERPGWIYDPPIEEMDEIGYEDYFYGEGVCLIEWADLIREILPEQMCRVTIEKDLEKGFDYRKITILDR